MGILIDSSVLIAAERGQLDLDRRMEEHAEEDMALTVITASELLHGVHRATRRHRGKREGFVEGVLARVPVVPIDLIAARVHARLWADLAKRGQAVGAHDLLIGATAVAIGFRVATRDARSFPRIPGLDVLLW